MKKENMSFIIVFVLAILSSCSSPKTNAPVVDEVAQEPTSNEEEKEEESEETPSNGTSVVDDLGQLRVSGKNLVDQNGNIVQLRGMSLSWSNWWPQFYTKAVVQWLKKDFNVTVVRASMGINEAGGYFDNKSGQKDLIFTVIDAAIEEGIYVLVDWHSHHAEDQLDEAKAFFAEVAQKYGDLPNILYETYNEPLDTPSWNGVIKPYHEAVIAEIRKYDPDNIVIAGTRTWSQRVDEVIGNRIDDANVMYTLHYYASTHKQELRNIAKTAIDADIPIFVTEYGVTEYTGDGFIDVAEANTWWDFLDEHKISWLNWSINDKEESSAAVKPGASGNGEWPDAMLTQSGLMVREELREKNPKYD